MEFNNFWIVPVVIVFIIMISMQYSLNRIVHLLKDIKKLLENDHNQPPYY